MATVIPKMTDPLGKHWNQPSADKIVLGKKSCMMTEQTFRELAEYSTTIPTGVYPGKMWKRHHNLSQWILCWYGDEVLNDKQQPVCPIELRKIDIVESIPTVKQ